MKVCASIKINFALVLCKTFLLCLEVARQPRRRRTSKEERQVIVEDAALGAYL